MSQKTRYCKLFNSIKDKKLNDETIKVFQYFDKNELHAEIFNRFED